MALKQFVLPRLDGADYDEAMAFIEIDAASPEIAAPAVHVDLRGA